MKSFKRTFSALLSLLLALALTASSCPFALAEEAEPAASETEPAVAGGAPDITAACDYQFSTKEQRKSAARIHDGKYTTAWRKQNAGAGWITIQSRDPAQPIAGLYFCFDAVPAQWAVQVPAGENGKDWETVYAGDNRYIHAWVALDRPAETVRFWSEDKKFIVKITELRVYGEGAFPAGAQQWLPTREQADILFLSSHADDELIFFGGGIPTYDTERGYQVVVAYLTGCGIRRNHELLDGLWSMGVRHYPVIGPFPDRHKKSMSAEYSALGGQKKVIGWVTRIFRQYKPLVVVTHDKNGEYGHYQHRVTAAAAMLAYDRAADPTRYTDSAELYGTWQVQKLYLHLGKNNPITMDWDVPLSSLGGITGLEAAIRAYAYHVSQQTTDMSVTKTGVKYSNKKFGLERTEVGPDEIDGDFMEHIEPRLLIE